MTNSDIQKIGQVVDQKINKALKPIAKRLDKIDSRLDKVDSKLDRLESKTDALILDVNDLQENVGGIKDKLVIIEEKHDEDTAQIKNHIGLLNPN
ncbi:MAG: hypothetical protein AAB512_05025 [Patescibacteria group bacterium]